MLVTLILAAAASPRPMEVAPSEWPLERIAANLEARIAAEPGDGDAHYTLGRAHAFAFALERSSLWAVIWDEGAWVNALEDQARWDSAARERPKANRPTPAELLDHLTKGVLHLLRACELGVPYGNPELTTGWLLESGAHLATRVDTRRLFGLDAVELSPQESESIQIRLASAAPGDDPAFPRELLRSPMLEKAAKYCALRSISSQSTEQARLDAFLRRFWLEQSLRHYRRELDLWNDSMPVLREAVDAYRRLVGQRGFLDAKEETDLVSQEKRLARLEQEKEGAPRASAITPLLVTLGCKDLDEIVVPRFPVPFDLDGDAVEELWPWIGPDEGWLVWDPSGRGEITSGRQLFGTASASLFFADGYRVLDALDDDRDGELRGAELAGIAVWFDRDTDGVSDRGEVVPVGELGIVALSTQATMRVGGSPANLCGMAMSDGRVLPTYDWVLAPVVP